MVITRETHAFGALLLLMMAACNAAEPEANAPRGESPPQAGPASTAAAPPADPWAHADSLILRLPPDAFSGVLPAVVIRALNDRGCTIPQAPDFDPQPHNIVRGAFTRAGQEDWAVLCSRRGSSAILVFRGGSPDGVVELAEGQDRGWLQGIGDGRIEFSRAIGAADVDYIRRQHTNYPGSVAPPQRMDHDGIEDRFLGKASTVYYFDDGRWLTLQGED